jgi:hypothetical protein
MLHRLLRVISRKSSALNLSKTSPGLDNLLDLTKRGKFILVRRPRKVANLSDINRCWSPVVLCT